MSQMLGCIGTGTVSQNGTGGLVDWEICNRPDKGFTPAGEKKGLEENR